MKLGFIGAGNMASAMIGGIINSKLINKVNIIASDTSKERLESVKQEFGINVTLDSLEVVKKSDIVIVAVKPYVYDEVLLQIKEHLTKEKIIVTIAAGKTIKNVEDIIGKDKKIVRTMPNTPALVNEGMSSLSPNLNITQEELEIVKAIYDAFGKSEVIKEELIDVVIGMSGSSPAYYFMMIEAMADCAVSYGISRDKAYEFVAQSMLGAAKMVLNTNVHPASLKDMVCSPSGTTIEGVKVLEEEGFRKSIIKGMSAVIEKSIKMNEQD